MTDAATEARRWLAALPTDPDIHLHSYDLAARSAVLVRLDEARYRSAAFLDDRALTPETPGLTVPLELALQAGAAVPTRPLDAIFHVSHCGSTLISRLLGALPNNLPKREPLTWLACGVHARQTGITLTDRALDTMFQATLNTLGRRYRDDQRVLLKSSSLSANLLGGFLRAEPSQRAILVTTPLEAWLANILASPEHRVAAERNADLWFADLYQGVGAAAFDLDDHPAIQRIVACWIAPMIWFADALRRSPERTRFVVAGDVIEHPAVGLAALAAFLGLAADAAAIEAVVQGPLLAEYSKAPDRPFDAPGRAAQLADARERHAEEIAAGMKFAEYFAEEPLVARHLTG